MNDPINPAHYNGTACAQIGERLTANSYQVLKYNWRLGRKDDPIIETGKSIWYLDREINLARSGWRSFLDIPNDDFFAPLLQGQEQYVVYVACRLIDWNRSHSVGALELLRNAIIDKRAELEAASTGQTTMAI